MGGWRRLVLDYVAGCVPCGWPGALFVPCWELSPCDWPAGVRCELLLSGARFYPSYSARGGSDGVLCGPRTLGARSWAVLGGLARCGGVAFVASSAWRVPRMYTDIAPAVTRSAVTSAPARIRAMLVSARIRPRHTSAPHPDRSTHGGSTQRSGPQGSLPDLCCVTSSGRCASHTTVRAQTQALRPLKISCPRVRGSLSGPMVVARRAGLGLHHNCGCARDLQGAPATPRNVVTSARGAPDTARARRPSACAGADTRSPDRRVRLPGLAPDGARTPAQQPPPSFFTRPRARAHTFAALDRPSSPLPHPLDAVRPRWRAFARFAQVTSRALLAVPTAPAARSSGWRVPFPSFLSLSRVPERSCCAADALWQRTRVGPRWVLARRTPRPPLRCGRRVSVDGVVDQARRGTS